MNRFVSNLNIGKRIGLGFLLVLVIVAGLGAFAMSELRKIHGAVSAISQDSLPGMTLCAEIDSAASDVPADRPA